MNEFDLLRDTVPVYRRSHAAVQGLSVPELFRTPDRDAGIGSLGRHYNTIQTADRVVHMRDGQVQKIEVNATRMDRGELEW